MENLISLLGFVVFGVIAWLFCMEKSKIKWRPVIGGVILQAILGTVVFLIPVTRNIFLLFSELFTKVLECSREGIVFVFGQLGAANSPQGLILAFQVFPFIITFSALMAFLYYIKLIPFTVKWMAWGLSKTLKTSGAESLCATSNIFAGIESETAIRPYLDKMTDSELFLILTVGMGSVASSVLAVYVSFLYPVFPAIAGHLVSASLLSVPASFVIAKLMVPETLEPETADYSKCKIHSDDDYKSITEALLCGSMTGAKLAVGVGVTLIGFIGMLGIVRGLFAYFTGDYITIEGILAYIFYPMVWLLGISPHEIPAAAKMLGERLILTEIPAYLDLAKFAQSGGSPRTVLIISYALCGFAHIASMAIFVGGTAAMIPSRISTLSKMGPKALLAATLVTLMTGAVAGIFYWGQTGIIR